MPLERRMLEGSVRINSFDKLEGTGFIVTVPSAAHPEWRWGYVVTAHHVAVQMETTVVAFDPLNPGQLHDPVPVSDWRQPLPGVDLAIAPFSADGRPLSALKLEDHVVPTTSIPEPNLGAHVYYIGVFSYLERMIARSGTIAALDVPHVSHNTDHCKHSAHLLDCRSYNGFSGSPCFFEIAYATTREQDLPYPTAAADDSSGLTAMAYFQLLFGMFVAHFCDDVSAQGATSRYGVGVLVRSQEIHRALRTKEARAEQALWDSQGHM